jgi:serine/threonine protein kinase
LRRCYLASSVFGYDGSSELLQIVLTRKKNMPASDDRHDDKAGFSIANDSENFGMLDPDATVDSSHLADDSDATLNSSLQSVQNKVNSDGEMKGENADSDATYVPTADVQSKVKEWEASITDDAEPRHTLKSPLSTGDPSTSTAELTVVLKRRSVSQSLEAGEVQGSDTTEALDYRTEKLLGEGGMGAVYAARQQSMDRPVAIKVLKPRGARLESNRRAFVSEAVITGGLDHPNIVPIYDVGKQADDTIFYAMKQVEGVEWKDRLAENSIHENVEILLRVSDAIAFAHARCIIHRDLKPANIMLGGFGEVLVMDWGLAMPSQDHPHRDSFPIAKRGGTPLYMAPEMADDPMLCVDRRSDVYLLGAILFEVVTGKPPHALEPKSGTGSRRDRVKACLAAAAQNIITATDESGELVEIARRALATDPADRFQTVPEFQKAIRDYLEHEESIELTAHAAESLNAARLSSEYDDFSHARFGFETALEQWPDNSRAAEGLKETRKDYAQTAFSRGDFDLALSLFDETDSDQLDLADIVRAAATERTSRTKRLRRLRRFSIATSLAIAVLASGAAVWISAERDKALTAQHEEATQRGIAEKNGKEAQEQRQVAMNAERDARLAEANAKREADNARRSLKIAERNAYNSDMLLAQRDWEDTNIVHLQRLLNKHRDRNDLKGFEWGYWDRQCHNNLLTLKGHSGYAHSVVFSPDGQHLASAGGKYGRQGEVKVWNLATGQELLTLKGHDSFVVSVAFSPDGQRLASAGGDDQTVKVWDVATGQESLTLKGHSNRVYGVAFSPDGQRLASASWDKTVKVWDVASGQELLTLKGHASYVMAVAYSPDGQRLASASHDKTVKVWDAATGQESLTLKGHTHYVGSVAFSPDGQRLASASFDKTVKVWDAATGQESFTLKGHTSRVYGVTFSPDGQRLASAGGDDLTVRVWNAATGQESLTLKGHTRCRSVNQGWMRGGYVGILFILPSMRRQEQCVML